ncbi:MAG: T9SS type A sorting domain-containing protein [Bacteroidia bacterium]|nr:T9SS type A sorting domain-containing protein [Bacteroidia bacterium]
MRLRLLLSMLLITGAMGLSYAQTTILDFETAATSTDFFYFGSSIDGTTVSAIANPDKSGINTSDSVMAHLKPSGSQTWAGAFTDPNPATAVDVTNGNMVCMKVWMPVAGNVMLKFEASTTGGANWEVAKPVTATNQWVEVCWDPSTPSDADPLVTASGNIYARVVVFFNFGTAGNDDTYFFDDIVVMPAATTVCNTILDFEAPATTTNFFYFGSSIDGTIVGPIANPDKSGINVSDSVMAHLKPVGSQVWAGAFSDPNPTTAIDVTGGGDICMKVWMPVAGNVMLKLEASTTGGANWEVAKPVTATNQWVEVCWSPSTPSDADPLVTATGNIYARVVVFFNFGTAGTDDTYFFDDLCVNSAGGGPTNSDVTFSLNLNGYTGSGTQPTVNGSFNGFSGTANPLSDADGDGIWTTTISIPAGLIEYKFAFDDWAVQEEFNGTETCTRRDPSGQFVNRAAVIAGDVTLGPVCWNSCYNCGDAVSITYNVGFPGSVTPSPDGVYLAGGAAFGAPGGEFRLADGDGDGVYSLTIERENGFNSFYTFANGNCPDYSCKEDIAGQSCANPNNFNDRFLDAVTADVVVNTCFGICSDNTLCSVGIRDQLVENLFSIAPSPTADVTTVSLLSATSEQSQLVVMDMQGRTVYQVTLGRGETTHQLRVSDWSAGVYLVHFRNGQNYGIQKLMVE